MGIIKSKKVLLGFLFFLVYFDRKQTRKIKITVKHFRTHDTHLNNIYSFIQFYSNYLKAGR